MINGSKVNRLNDEKFMYDAIVVDVSHWLKVRDTEYGIVSYH